jgi:hypothetical protein
LYVAQKKTLCAVKTWTPAMTMRVVLCGPELDVKYLKVRFHIGSAHMPRYLTQHTLACLTRQGAENLAQRMQSGGTARAERVLVNMLEGKMFVEFRAESREALEAWLKTEGMHFDWVVRIEWETRGQDGKLHSAD